MKQAIAGVSPSQSSEAIIMTVWPSIAAFGLGQRLGQLYSRRSGIGLLTVGKAMMLVSIPLSLALFAWSLLPFASQRYIVTNRRIAIQRGLRATVAASVEFDGFDAIEIQVLPGQQWYPAGELIFRSAGVEKLRLSGVSRPETFRQVCLKAQMSHLGVRKALGRELVAT